MGKYNPYDPQVLANKPDDSYTLNLERAQHELELQAAENMTSMSRIAAEVRYLRGRRVLGGPGSLASTETITHLVQEVYYNNNRTYYDISKNMANISFSSTLKSGIASGSGEFANRLQRVFDAVGENMRGNVGLKSKMDRIAAEARQATVDSYKSLVKESFYRANQNRLVFHMLRALERPNWCFGTADGVVFGDVAVLDAEAANWHRLNFGASPAGNQRKPHVGTMYMSLDARGPSETGTPIMQFGIVEPPSPAFRIPPGVFVSNDATGTIAPFGSGRGQAFFTQQHYLEFYGGGIRSRKTKEGAYSVREGKRGPLSERKRRAFEGGFTHSRTIHQNVFTPYSNDPTTISYQEIFAAQRRKPHFSFTRGIEGKHFMDAGVRVIRRQLPQAYAETINGWFRDADRAVPRGPLRGF